MKMGLTSSTNHNVIRERNRDQDKQSEPWAARQTRKVNGGLQALNSWYVNINDRTLSAPWTDFV